MYRDDIVIYGEDVLRQKAQDITDFNDEVRELINHMYEVMEENKGLGLAGPQIGISKRIFVYDIGEGPHAMINPVFVKKSGKECGIEGCLSIPGLQGEVTRADKVTIKGIDENGEEIIVKAEGLLARVFQHEMDHLDGTLFIDKADPDTLETISQGESDENDKEEEED